MKKNAKTKANTNMAKGGGKKVADKRKSKGKAPNAKNARSSSVRKSASKPGDKSKRSSSMRKTGDDKLRKSKDIRKSNKSTAA